MKRIIYLVLIGLSFIAPLKRIDIARLQPIEAVGLMEKDGQIIIITDTNDMGAGYDADAALRDLVQNTPGIVYLDTAQYLLVTESAIDEIGLLRNDLKDSVKLCLWDGTDDLKTAVKYLSVHGDMPQLKHWTLGEALPEYICKK